MRSSLQILRALRVFGSILSRDCLGNAAWRVALPGCPPASPLLLPCSAPVLPAARSSPTTSAPPHPLPFHFHCFIPYGSTPHLLTDGRNDCFYLFFFCLLPPLTYQLQKAKESYLACSLHSAQCQAQSGLGSSVLAVRPWQMPRLPEHLSVPAQWAPSLVCLVARECSQRKTPARPSECNLCFTEWQGLAR